ncbi:MAG: 4Fe-4S dicluster domain-containing protein [Pseudomonadota bacterium]
MQDDLRNKESARAKTRLEINYPPGTNAAVLSDLCMGCGDCAAVCPSDLIALDADRFPVVSALENCGRCGLCADVCSHGAIEFNDATLAGLRMTLATERQMSNRLLLK